MSDPKIPNVKASEGVAPPELMVPRSDVDQYGMGGTSAQDTANVFAAAMRDAKRKLGDKATQDEIDAEAGRIASGYIYKTVVPQAIAKLYGKGAAEAYQGLVKAEAELQKKLGENGTQIFMNGWSLIQQSNLRMMNIANVLAPIRTALSVLAFMPKCSPIRRWLA
jgi:hypothetical protein